MRISELIVEDQNIEEISLGGVARGIGKVAGAVGSVPGVAVGAWQAAKQGYQKGKAAVSGTAAPTTSGASTAAAPQGTAPASATSATQQASPAATPSAAVSPTVKQINAIIPTLRTRDLQSIKKKLDAIIAQKSAGRPAAAPAAPTMNVVQGGGRTQSAAPVQLAPLPAGTTIPAVEGSKYHSKFLNMKI